MSTRFLGWPPAVLATLITVALVVGELTDAGQRRWWATHPLTTDTVAGLLVLLITVLVVNQLLIRRQNRQRGHAVASQAAIMAAQAVRSAQAVASDPAAPETAPDPTTGAPDPATDPQYPKQEVENRARQ